MESAGGGWLLSSVSDLQFVEVLQVLGHHRLCLLLVLLEPSHRLVEVLSLLRTAEIHRVMTRHSDRRGTQQK